MPRVRLTSRSSTRAVGKEVPARYHPLPSARKGTVSALGLALQGQAVVCGSNARPDARAMALPAIVIVGAGAPVTVDSLSVNSTSELIVETQRSPLPSNASPAGASLLVKLERAIAGMGFPDPAAISPACRRRP